MSNLLSSLSKTIHTSLALAIILFLGLFYLNDGIAIDTLFWSWLFRYIHVIVAIMWIGLLWYFNFVQIPNMGKIPDEQTTGLHQHDIKKLLEILHTFVKLGNTVVVIEHNLDVIKTADYIVDMGPEGGVKGGNIVAEGKPEEVCKVKDSYTGQFLKTLLA